MLGKYFPVLVLIGLGGVPGLVFAEQVTGSEVVERCEAKDPGKDQVSRLSITLIDKDKKKRVNVYARLWKNYYGKNDVLDKMVLYTVYPPDAKGTGFMRWGYVATSGEMADQWLYLPSLRKIRRVSVRDPGDSFLGSDLTYGDIEERAISDDDHSIIKVEKISGIDHIVVESRPKEDGSLYSKRVSWYKMPKNVSNCVRVKTDYYDSRGSLLKKQELSWQQVDGAWAWDKVIVSNVQTRHQSVFTVTDVKVGVGLKDKQFTERGLKKGM